MVLLLTLPLSVDGEEGRQPVTTYTARDTGTRMESWVTTQDERGVRYFGCDAVLSFDGERWRSYSVPGSYAVRGLAFGANGRLWVGAVNEIGYFDRTAKGLSEFHSILNYLPEKERALGDVWQAIACGNGALFVTDDTILVWDGSAIREYSLPGARRLRALSADGKIFISQTTTGVWSVGNGGITKFIDSNTLGNSGAILLEREPKDWVVVTTTGLFHLIEGKLSPFGSQASEFIRKNVLISACQGLGGMIFLGSLNGGVAVVSPSGAILRTITIEDGLLSNSVYSLFVSRGDALWATSPLGITRISIDSGVSEYDSANGLTGKPCNSITQGGDRLFVATDEQVFTLTIGDNSKEDSKQYAESRLLITTFRRAPIIRSTPPVSSVWTEFKVIAR